MWQSHCHYPFNSLHSSLNHRKQALPVPYLYSCTTGHKQILPSPITVHLPTSSSSVHRHMAFFLINISKHTAHSTSPASPFLFHLSVPLRPTTASNTRIKPIRDQKSDERIFNRRTAET